MRSRPGVVARLMTLVVLSTLVVGCEVKVKELEAAAKSVEALAKSLDNQSLAFANLPSELNKVAEQQRGALREDISTVATRVLSDFRKAEQMLGTEARCVTDHAIDQAKFELATLSMSISNKANVILRKPPLALPSPSPKFCTPSDTQLNRADIGTDRLSELRFTGWNLYASCIEAIASSTADGPVFDDRGQLDASCERLTRTSVVEPYVYALAFDKDDVPRSKKWRRILIYTLSNNVRNPQPPIQIQIVDPAKSEVRRAPIKQQVRFLAQPITVWPERISNGANNEFGGRGGPSADVAATFRISDDGRALQAQLSITVWESDADHGKQSDHTRGAKITDWLDLYRCASGSNIVSPAPAGFSVRIRDSGGTGEDTLPQQHALIQRLQFWGDVSGADLASGQGENNYCRVVFVFKEGVIDLETP